MCIVHNVDVCRIALDCKRQLDSIFSASHQEEEVEEEEEPEDVKEAVCDLQSMAVRHRSACAM